jgi:cysteinyl-tRNA synthetase
MAETLLGVDFEIHGGGADLVFPHHENEAAQTHAARGAPLARLWVHNGMVRLDRTKMSKSEGNIFVLADALDAYGRDALIMYFLNGHYRQPVEFDDERLTQAQANVDRIREAARGLRPGPSPEWSASLREEFFDALADDFNTQRALAPLWAWIRHANRSAEPPGNDDLGEMLGVVGLSNLLEVATDAAPDQVTRLADEREEARAAREWERADALRAQIAELGWEVRDGPNGPELVPSP